MLGFDLYTVIIDLIYFFAWSLSGEAMWEYLGVYIKKNIK